MPFPLSLAAWILLSVTVLGAAARMWSERGHESAKASPLAASPAGLVGVLFGVGGGATLIQTAGPTSLSFLLIGAALGAVLGIQRLDKDPASSWRGVRSTLLEAHARFGGLTSAALLVCATWMGGRAIRQSMESLDASGEFPMWAVFALATTVAAAVVFDPWGREETRRPWPALVWAAAGIWIALLAAAIFATDGGLTRLRGLVRADTTIEGLGPLAGLVGVAASFGLLRGLTIAWPWATTFLAPSAARPRVRALMSAAAISVAVTAMSGVAVVGTGVSPFEQITERQPGSEQANTLLLGPVHARGLLPNMERGQIIVLPEDTPLEENRRYPMRFQAPPRGAKIGRLEGRKGWVRIPNWEILNDVTHVWFRMKEPEHAQVPSWDLRVPVVREIVRGTVTDPNETSLRTGEQVDAVVLRPADPDISFALLASQMDGPFIPTADLHIVGTVARAANTRYGDFLAMYEDRPAAAPENPSLREAISIGLSGPFFDTTEGEPPLPVSFVSTEGGEFEDGEVLPTTIRSLPRGLKIGKVLKLESKRELATPRWEHLAAVRLGRLRHDDDPSRDIIFPLSRRLADDGTYRFASLDSRIKIGSEKLWARYSGPYLEVPPIALELEVRGDARLPTELAGRHALVPRGTAHAPVSPFTDGPFRPHPAELQLVGFGAPVISHEGAGWLTRAVSLRLGETAAWLFNLCTAMLLGLAVGISLASARAAARHPARSATDATSRADGIVLLPLALVSWTLGFALSGGSNQAWAVVDALALAGFFFVAACAVLGMTRRRRPA